VTIQTSATALGGLALSNSIRTLYMEKYLEAAAFSRVYDQLAHPVEKDGVESATFLGSAVQAIFLSDLEPSTSAISQIADVTPSALRDAVVTITPTSRGGATQWAESIDLMAYTNYGESRFKAIGKALAESVDLLAQAAALQGSNVWRYAARASLDAGTSTHRFTDAIASELMTLLQTLKCPYFDLGNGEKKWIAIMPPSVFHDLRTGGNIVSVGQYQQGRIILNFELGEIGPFKLVVTPWAKVFGAAGAANAAPVATTLSSAASALGTTIVVASASNITSGDWLTIGTAETANTFYPTNERVRVSADYSSGTTINIIGEGANGGLRFDHTSGTAVSNADNVFPVAFGSPFSLAKIFDKSIGEFGRVVGPLRQGLLEQFASLGYKWYGNYGRWSESWLLRGEFATSLEA
jgi:N4-gp56 family major capsid protein